MTKIKRPRRRKKSRLSRDPLLRIYRKNPRRVLRRNKRSIILLWIKFLRTTMRPMSLFRLMTRSRKLSRRRPRRRRMSHQLKTRKRRLWWRPRSFSLLFAKPECRTIVLLFFYWFYCLIIFFSTSLEHTHTSEYQSKN